MENMDLTSCDYCGVVYNRQAMTFPSYDDIDNIDTSDFEWDGIKYIPKIQCGVCNKGFIYQQDL